MPFGRPDKESSMISAPGKGRSKKGHVVVLLMDMRESQATCMHQNVNDVNGFQCVNDMLNHVRLLKVNRPKHVFQCNMLDTQHVSCERIAR